MDQRVTIHHWRHEDGKTQPNPESKLPLDPPPRGWYCWVYCDDHRAFLDWMEKHCPKADCTPRFNSGNPMVTVHIKDQDEAAYFLLNFEC